MTRGVSDRVRLDVLLTERGLAPTRTKAQDLVRSGRVIANGAVVDRPGVFVARDTELDVRAARDFVSRGGHKLDGALDELGVDVRGATFADIGASTGGFTDCLLQRGAARVFAVDVGHDQLHAALKNDPRVVSREGVNARDLDAPDFPERLDGIVVDASFISIEKIARALARVAPPGALVLALVKPQFEVGRAAARKSRGVVRDPEVRRAAIEGAKRALRAAGFQITGECDSKVHGPDGNVECFVLARRTA